jgi:hypothetical protein
MSPRSWYISSIPPSLRSDPAFSADPHTHLYYSTHSNDTLQPGGQRRPSKNTSKNSPPPTQHSQHPQKDDWPNMPPPYQQYPPPHDPYYIHSRIIYEVSPSSSSKSSSSKSSSTPSSIAPSSTSSHSSLSTPALTPDLDPKPLPSSTRPQRQAHDHQMLRPEYYEPQRPAQSRSETAPELYRPPQRPIQPPRPVTTPVVEQRSHRAKNRRHLPQTSQLDKIDELDETDPFNLGWHHDGPYEAIRQNLSNMMEQKKVRTIYPYPMCRSGAER